MLTQVDNDGSGSSTGDVTSPHDQVRPYKLSSFILDSSTSPKYLPRGPVTIILCWPSSVTTGGNKNKTNFIKVHSYISSKISNGWSQCNRDHDRMLPVGELQLPEMMKSSTFRAKGPVNTFPDRGPSSKRQSFRYFQFVVIPSHRNILAVLSCSSWRCSKGISYWFNVTGEPTVLSCFSKRSSEVSATLAYCIRGLKNVVLLILFTVVNNSEQYCWVRIRCNNAEQYCWQLWTM